ncbi:MAG: ribonuclease P protein component [Scytonema sp. PMC 1069.18]|nr:ribonuclease P protein component [Scytonema sp. PMC 1069.18]MEC4882316.1 ribonuclease P protein component [Scytonema sp. PMC 1070.18]
MALPKAHRLKSRKDFKAVFQEGTRRHSSHFTLRALRPSSSVYPSMEAATETTQAQVTLPPVPTKIGISVSTKVSKRAVIRNRLKRQIVAALYQLLPKMASGWRLVIVVKPIAAESKCGSQQFLQELEQLLAKAEVLNGHS